MAINGWSDERKVQFLAVSAHGTALLQLQKSGNGHVGKLCHAEGGITEKICGVELHKAQFRARHCERDEKLSDLANSLRILVLSYLEAVPDLPDSLANAQFIDVLED